MPDERTRALRRRLQRRPQLVKARTRAKNEVHGALIRRLVAKPKVSDLFGLAGRRWLEGLELPDEERETVDSALRQIDFLEAELQTAERVIAQDAPLSVEMRRLMSVPGVNVITAAAFWAPPRASDRSRTWRGDRTRDRHRTVPQPQPSPLWPIKHVAQGGGLLVSEPTTTFFAPGNRHAGDLDPAAPRISRPPRVSGAGSRAER